MEIKKLFFIFLFFLILTGCANKNINLSSNQKIALEGIDKKHFCQKDYSTGYIGGCGGSVIEGGLITYAVDGYLNVAIIGIGGYYIVYKIADYNKKPIQLEYIWKKEKFKKTIFLIDKYLKFYLPKNYININNLKFPKIKKPNFYYKKINQFAKSNNLSYTIFLYIKSQKDILKIEWDIYNKHHILKTTINTKCQKNKINECVKKFVQKIKIINEFT